MERNPMKRVSMYKGYIVEYTGIPDQENPIGLIFDDRCDTWRILISGSISPFLTDVVAECIINKDNEGLQNILEKQGLSTSTELHHSETKKPKLELSQKAQLEILEILERKKL